MIFKKNNLHVISSRKYKYMVKSYHFFNLKSDLNVLFVANCPQIQIHLLTLSEYFIQVNDSSVFLRTENA